MFVRGIILGSVAAIWYTFHGTLCYWNLSALLAPCKRNQPISVDFLPKEPMMLRFIVALIQAWKVLEKNNDWWFETSRRLCDVTVIYLCAYKEIYFGMTCLIEEHISLVFDYLKHDIIGIAHTRTVVPGCETVRNIYTNVSQKSICNRFGSKSFTFFRFRLFAVPWYEKKRGSCSSYFVLLKNGGGGNE